MMAVLSTGCKAGMNERSDIVRIQAPTMIAALISLRVNGPNSELSWRAFSLSPGMVFFSGLKKTIKNPHSRRVMIQPMGNIYQVN